MKTPSLIIMAILLFLSCFSPKKTTEIESQLIQFSDTKNPEIQYYFSTKNNFDQLKELREEYKIESLISKQDSQIHRVLKVMHWVHNQWKHNGSNNANSSKGLEILKKAQSGENFRCVEYGIVLKDALNSIGINTRLLELKIRNADLAKHSAGHVLVEVYLSDAEKWIMADGQFNLLPMLDGTPLSSIELLENLKSEDQLQFRNINGRIGEKSKKKYLDFITEYLYYFNTNIDNRYGIKNTWKTIQGKSQIMLVPLGAKELRHFEKGPELRTFFYTNSKQDFYKKPIEVN